MQFLYSYWTLLFCLFELRKLCILYFANIRHNTVTRDGFLPLMSSIQKYLNTFNTFLVFYKLYYLRMTIVFGFVLFGIE